MESEIMEFEAEDDNFSVGAFTEKTSIFTDGGERFGVSSLCWDVHEELLWSGNQGGHVTSYYGNALDKYTSFQVHSTNDIRQLITFDAGILAVTPQAVRCQSRRGVPVYTYSSESCEDLQCILLTSSTSVLVGGHQSQLFEIDLVSSKCSKKVDIGEEGCAILRHHPRYICAGNATGYVTLRDPRTLREEHRFLAHTGSLSDFDVHNNLLVTCGFSNRQGGMMPDRFLKVYDVRMLRALNPLPLVGEPFLLRFLPAFSSQLSVVTAMGQLQILDAAAPASSAALQLHQINTEGSLCTALDVSSSCQYIAVGDAGGYVHVMASNHSAPINTFSRPTEFPDHVEPVPPLALGDTSTPLSTVPMPYPNGPLLSDWPDISTRHRYREVPVIPHEILSNMRMVGTVGYAPNPSNRRANQVSYGAEKRMQRNGKNILADGSVAREDNGNSPIPKRYRRAEVRFTKGGIDESDYARYNTTPYCGLENTLPNSYCNAALQVLYFIPEIRRSLLGHLCYKEFCLACELAFLFRMLDIGKGIPVQPANFLRAFRTLPEAFAMGLLLPDHAETKQREALPRLIQSWTRFVLQQLNGETQCVSKKVTQIAEVVKKVSESPEVAGMVSEVTNQSSVTVVEVREETGKIPEEETGRIPEEESPVAKVLGLKQQQINRCSKCGSENQKLSTVLLTTLTCSESDGTFQEVLERSLNYECNTPAWCEKCQRYQPTNQKRHPLNLPPILALGCNNDTPQGLAVWKNRISAAESHWSSPSEEAPEAGLKAKPCRYGAECSRPNCKFWHQSEASHAHVTHQHVQLEAVSQQSWIPLALNLSLSPEKGVCVTNEEMAEKYVLHGVVQWIDEPRDSKHSERRHLTASIRVLPPYRERKGDSQGYQWYLFNDFRVAPITAQEAVSFFADWKMPCVLFYAREAVEQIAEDSANPITADVFKEDKSLAQKSEGLQRISFLPLAADEMPGKGDLVAMDAEFVTLNQEEAELRSDGKSTTVRPSQMSVARITVIRGTLRKGLRWTSAEYRRQGSMEGLPFIDDYIATHDQVVDYLTKFSGIQPGDLDISSSSKHLTTLKSTYLKLRFLIDNGVTFVGHGLKNDFRVINLVVPPSQVIDTVHLFHLQHQRMVSLRFLAWHFLGLKIQSVTHDSVEDARTALRLYRRYQELKERGEDVLNEAIQELYNVGRRLQWTVPGLQEE